MERLDCERKGSYLEKRDAAYLPSPSKEQSKFQVNALALQRDKTYVSSIDIYIYIAYSIIYIHTYIVYKQYYFYYYRFTTEESWQRSHRSRSSAAGSVIELLFRTC